ncbi:hypothetical protein PsYK624_027770 [Phanerochaete sordida]|uniref:Uncharacterized protein n=1 Tax=Phanerochaete sordida TaxID=48140 RepID=A0A9P3L8Z9_9APHY|nr:hypothetical protein PsYK624_027770 [Phanerochaete sordida]
MWPSVARAKLNRDEACQRALHCPAFISLFLCAFRARARPRARRLAPRRWRGDGGVRRHEAAAFVPVHYRRTRRSAKRAERRRHASCPRPSGSRSCNVTEARPALRCSGHRSKMHSDYLPRHFAYSQATLSRAQFPVSSCHPLSTCHCSDQVYVYSIGMSDMKCITQVRA